MNRELQSRRTRSTMVMALRKPVSDAQTSQPAPQPTATRPKTGSRLRILIAVVVFLLLGGVFLRRLSSSDLHERISPSHSSIRQVHVTTPERASTAEIVLPATIEAYQATDLFARANGFLKGWYFDIGAPVKMGQVLAEIETPELDQELAQAVSLLKQGRAEYEQAVAELEEAKADVALAEANIVKAKANLEFSNSQAQRYQSLFNSRSVSREQYEGSVRDRDARAAELESAKAELTRRKSNLNTRQAIIESREATVGNREANVQRLRDLTGFQKVVAPFDGIVVRRNAEVGMLVTAGSNTGTRPLFGVAQIDTLRIHVSVPQSSALGIKPGDQARITIPERPGQVYTAKVSRTAGVLEPTSRSLLVEVELPNPGSSLLPGVYAQVRFQSPKEQASWMIPGKALLLRSNGPHVVTVTSDGSLRTQQVTLGRDFGATVEVLVGLEGNERLVVNPSDDLRDGQTVQIAASDNGSSKR